MKRFRKGFNFRLLIVTLSICFVSNNALYALRVPLSSEGKEFSSRFKDGTSLFFDSFQDQDFRSVIHFIWDKNSAGEYPGGINLLSYPDTYGAVAIYELLGDLRNNGYTKIVSPRTAPKKINNIIGRNIYRPGDITLKQYLNLQHFMKGLWEQNKLKEYWNLKNLVSLAKKSNSELEKEELEIRETNLAQLTGLINNKIKVAAILEVKLSDSQLENWNMPYVDMTWEQFEAISKWLKDTHERKGLKGYGDKAGIGLVKLLKEIKDAKKDESLSQLKGIHIGQLTSLINNKIKVAAILGVKVTDSQLENWNMPYVDMTWEQFELSIKIDAEISTRKALDRAL